MHRTALNTTLTLLLLTACTVPQPTPSPKSGPADTDHADIAANLPSVRFESGEARLTLEQRQQVRDIARALKSVPETASVRVTGHTDDHGSERANLEVGLRRAQAVARELVFNGVLPERLIVESQGQSVPVAPNSTPDGGDNPEGRALNRRVDIVLAN